jgi:LysR family transcriptional regulator of beta-lactamase
LLRSYRADEWRCWFEAAGVAEPLVRGPVFDSSALMVAAATNGLGVALAPAAMFMRELSAERLVQPFEVTIDAGRYWLTRLFSRKENDAMRTFRRWLLKEAATEGELSGD